MVSAVLLQIVFNAVDSLSAISSQQYKKEIYRTYFCHYTRVLPHFVGYCPDNRTTRCAMSEGRGHMVYCVKKKADVIDRLLQ